MPGRKEGGLYRMTEEKLYPIFPEISENTHLTEQQYAADYARSIADPDQFWSDKAREFITWDKLWTNVSDVDFATAEIKWFVDAKLNVSKNCLDRHLEYNSEKIAIIWEGDNPEESRTITYSELYEEVCRFSNALKRRGVKKGDRVSIYMPMIPEAAIAMLACTRIGAIHSVVFGGFSPDALKDRILDSGCSVVVTADEGLRGGKVIPLKNNVDSALLSCPDVKVVFVVNRTGGNINWVEKRDVWYYDAVSLESAECEPESMSSEDPLFILYTSGSTGKPKGVLHTTGGYILYAAMTHHYVFDHRSNDIYWCTADVGWVTGHSYIVYGPLANCATTLMFEGVPNYPDASRCWQIIDKYGVNVFYTAPTALRALMGQGDEFVDSTNRESLRILGTVGEPINPEAWEWYFRVVGRSKCPIVDTWWQTETGGILITPLPGATKLKPGSATRPFFGIHPVILSEEGKEIEGEATGALAIKKSWPGQMRTVYHDHQRFIDTYFSTFKGYYFTGDGARRDSDGYFWITGRMDDVINVSGHRMGTAEVESALVLHEDVSEAAVVGYPHKIKGQGIYAYVTLMRSVSPNLDLEKALKELVRKEIGAIAIPDIIQWTPELPKTRSGKIMRRILRKVASQEFEQLGDTSTLADSAVVKNLITERQKFS